MAARAFVCLCPNRPNILGWPVLGHVGWGYEYPDGSWAVGSSEGPNWKGIWNGFWKKRLPNLQEAVMFFSYNMRVLCDTEYNYYKMLTVNNGVKPNPREADRIVEWVSQQEYWVSGRNCMNDTYDVLRAFAGGCFNGTELPSPQSNWIPNGWFNAIQTNEYYHLPKPPARQHGHSCEYGSGFLDGLVTPQAPPEWRVVGRPDFLPVPALDRNEVLDQPAIPPTEPSPFDSVLEPA